MNHASDDRYEESALVDGFDYDLQVWVRDGLCEHVGLNRDLYGDLPWLEARVRAFGLEGHLERLKAGREP